MAKYGFTLSNGKQAVITANSEEEARRKKAEYEAKLKRSDPSLGETAYSAFAKTGQSIASLIPESIGGPDPAILKKAIAGNKQTLEDAGGWGTAADIGAQVTASLPLALATSFAAPAAGALVTGAKVLQQAPRLGKALGALTTGGVAAGGAATEGALVEEPGLKGEAAGWGAGIQAGIEAIPVAGKVLGKTLTKTVGGVEGITKWLQDQAVKLFEQNPGLKKSEMAKRLEDIVDGLDLPLANSAKADMVRRVSQLMEYFPLSGGRETYKTAEKRIRDELLDLAEGSGAPPKLPVDEPVTGVWENIKKGIFGDDVPYDRNTQKRLRQIQDTATDDYARIINTREFDPVASYENVVVGLSQNSDSFVRDLTGDVVTILRKSLTPEGKISGRSIGNMKAELRALIPPDAPPYRRRIMNDIIKQLDDDLAKQMPAEDAARYQELNSLYPERKMVEGSMADVPLGEFDAQTGRKVLQRETSTRQLARGEGRSQEIIDLSAEIMKRKPPSTSSPWAMAALLSSVVTMFAPVVATVGGRTKLANAIRKGDVPDALKNDPEFKNLRKWAQTLSDDDLFELMDMARIGTVPAAGVGGAQLSEGGQ